MNIELLTHNDRTGWSTSETRSIGLVVCKFRIVDYVRDAIAAWTGESALQGLIGGQRGAETQLTVQWRDVSLCLYCPQDVLRVVRRCHLPSIALAFYHSASTNDACRLYRSLRWRCLHVCASWRARVTIVLGKHDQLQSHTTHRSKAGSTKEDKIASKGVFSDLCQWSAPAVFVLPCTSLHVLCMMPYCSFMASVNGFIARSPINTFSVPLVYFDDECIYI